MRKYDMTNGQMVLWISIAAAPTLLVGANAMRLKIAKQILDKRLEEYQSQLSALHNFNPVARAQKPEKLERTLDEFKACAKNIDEKRQNIVDLEFRLPKPPKDVLASAENFNAYIRDMLSSMKAGYLSQGGAAITADVLSDAILNAALLKAFPNTAAVAGAGEVSDIVLGPGLKDLLNETGIIDSTAEFLTVVSGALSETIVVSAIEAAADPQLAIFSFVDITSREISLIKQGYSTPWQSLTHGAFDYGARASGIFFGLKFGTALGGSTAGPAGAIIGGLIGGAAGAGFGRFIYVRLLKSEIKDKTKKYEKAAKRSKRILDFARFLALGSIRNNAEKNLKLYSEVTKASPDLGQNENLKNLAGELREAWQQDLEAIDAVFGAKIDEIANSGKRASIIHKLFGADWQRQVRREATKIVHLKEKDMRYAAEGKSPEGQTAANAVEEILFLTSLKPLANGKSSDSYVQVPENLETAMQSYHTDFDKWAGRCHQAWETANDNTQKAVQKRLQVVQKVHGKLAPGLIKRQHEILCKSARIASKRARARAKDIALGLD